MFKKICKIECTNAAVSIKSELTFFTFCIITTWIIATTCELRPNCKKLIKLKPNLEKF